MASGTALIYDSEMTRHRLLWEDPICEIEVPERLTSSYEQLKHRGPVQRCMHVPIREGNEEEIMLVHSSEYLQIVKSTQKMAEEELRRVSENYDAVYFHPDTYHCAKLAVGASLQLVDSVMSGKVCNGIALVRPPGHHSQRAAANGFCIFNNVAIAAEYAKRKYGLQRILIVDWDIHHGQGTQYIFEEDPSVLYFSWHRYEHQQFWPMLRESDYDAIGRGKGKGFNINVPWNKTGMGNSDYLAAFFHVLLPLAFEFDPELVLVSAGYDSGIGDPEGGYHLKSLSDSVFMTVKSLLGDPIPQLSGEMVPCISAVESIQNVRAAHKTYWKCLIQEDIGLLQDLSTKSHSVVEPELLQSSVHPTAEQAVGKSYSDEAIKTERFLKSHMKKILSPVPPVKTSAAIVSTGAENLLPISVQVEKEMDTKNCKALISRFYSEGVKENEALIPFGNMLAVLDKILRKEVCNGIVESAVGSLCAAVALKHCTDFGLQRVLCIFVGEMDTELSVEDGKNLLVNICQKPSEKAGSKYFISLNWKEDTERNNFFSAALGFILPVAYSYQPDLIVIVVGPNRSLGINGISLLTSLLKGLAESRILAVIQDTEIKLVQSVAKALNKVSAHDFGVYASASQENVREIKLLRHQLQQEWKMLQCSVADCFSGS
uniref:Histone deacetylase 10 n=1 Tax=Crocodylus porosus TaxID=8502 RepID=A0A7M4EWC7_CROPO